MTEREMEDLTWNYPEKILNEPLVQVDRQLFSCVGSCDLLFKDHLDRLLVVELKKGKLGRGAIEQLHDYFGMVKKKFPGRPVELMVLANSIPEERRLACERLDIEWREISVKKFRDVAKGVGYVFASEKVDTEQVVADDQAQTRRSPPIFSGGSLGPTFYHEASVLPASDEIVEEIDLSKKLMYRNELRQWRLAALTDVRRSSSPRAFKAAYIPDEVQEFIRGKLDGAKTEEQVKEVFTEAKAIKKKAPAFPARKNLKFGMGRWLRTLLRRGV